MVSHGIMAGFQSGHGWDSPAPMPGESPDKFLSYGKTNPDMTVQFSIWHLSSMSGVLPHTSWVRYLLGVTL